MFHAMTRAKGKNPAFHQLLEYSSFPYLSLSLDGDTADVPRPYGRLETPVSQVRLARH